MRPTSNRRDSPPPPCPPSRSLHRPLLSLTILPAFTPCQSLDATPKVRTSSRALRISYRHHEDTSPAKRVLTISRPRARSSCLRRASPHWPRRSRSGRWERRRSSPNCERARTFCRNTTEAREVAILASFYPIPLASCPMIVGAVENRNPGMAVRSCLYLIVVSSSFQREVRAQGSVCQLPPRAGAAHGP